MSLNTPIFDVHYNMRVKWSCWLKKTQPFLRASPLWSQRRLFRKARHPEKKPGHVSIDDTPGRGFSIKELSASLRASSKVFRGISGC